MLSRKILLDSIQTELPINVSGYVYRCFRTEYLQPDSDGCDRILVMVCRLRKDTFDYLIDLGLEVAWHKRIYYYDVVKANELQ